MITKDHQVLGMWMAAATQWKQRKLPAHWAVCKSVLQTFSHPSVSRTLSLSLQWFSRSSLWSSTLSNSTKWSSRATITTPGPTALAGAQPSSPSAVPSCSAACHVMRMSWETSPRLNTSIRLLKDKTHTLTHFQPFPLSTLSRIWVSHWTFLHCTISSEIDNGSVKFGSAVEQELHLL